MKKKATVICWISTALAALALCLTCGLPLPAGIPPMLLQWLILPLLALLAAAVQAGRLLAGLRAALAGKPDGRLFCLLAAVERSRWLRSAKAAAAPRRPHCCSARMRGWSSCRRV